MPGILLPGRSTMPSPICISVINMKGGVGKTTIAALLSSYAARSLGREVLAIDLDPQANLSQALMGGFSYRNFLYDGSPSIINVFRGSSLASSLNATKIARDSHWRWSYNNLQIIPSRFDFPDRLLSSVRRNPLRLAQLIDRNFQDKNLVIIDCAPTESALTRAAYHASRYILVPVRPGFFATIGFPLLKKSIDDFKHKNPDHDIDVIGIVVNNSTYDNGIDGGPEKRRSMAEIREEARKNEWRIFSNELGYSRGFPKMMRGDFSIPGNAGFYHRTFAREFFSMPEMSSLRRKSPTRR